MNLLGIHFYKGTYTDCLTTLKSKRDGATLVVTPNPEMLYDAQNDPALLEILKNADIALPDGAGIFVAYQITQSRLPKALKYILFFYWCLRAVFHDESFTEQYGERITGSRLTADLLKYANENHVPVTIIDPIVQGDSE